MLKLITLFVSFQQLCINYNYYRVQGYARRTTKALITKRYYNPNYGHEAYWPGGERAEDPVIDEDPEFHFNICGRRCPERYRHIKQVCGRIIRDTSLVGCHPWDGPTLVGCGGYPPDDLSGGYETFHSYCNFLHYQCANVMGGDGIKYNPAQHKWIFVHVGRCESNQDNTFKPMYGNENINRMLWWITSLAASYQKEGPWTPPF